MSQNAIYKLIYNDVSQKIQKKIQDKKTKEKIVALRTLFNAGKIKEMEIFCAEQMPSFQNLIGLLNSSIISPRSKISNFNEAVVILGKNVLYNFASINILLNDLIEYYHYYLKLQMYHNLIVASISHSAAPFFLKKEDSEYEMFFAGFLHNFGKLLILSFEKGVYFNIFDEAKIEKMNYSKVEEIIYGDFFQVRLSADLLKFFGFSDKIIDIACGYFDIKKGKNQVECAALHMSDIIATGLFIGSSGDGKIPELQKETIKLCGINQEIIDAVYSTSIDRIIETPIFYNWLISEKNK